MEAFGFSHSEVMKMPFKTFLAYSRLAATRAANSRMAREFNKSVEE